MLNLFYCVETSPNPYGSLYSLPNSNVLSQPSPMYSSRTPSPLEYQFPNNVNPNTFYVPTQLPKISSQPPTGKLFYLFSLLF